VDIDDQPVRLAPESFWGKRVARNRDHTIPVLLERLEAHGVVDNFRRLAPGGPPVDRRGLWFTDSDLYKWMEAAAWAQRLDLLEPVVEVVLAAQQTDGYLHTWFGVPGGAPRYSDLSNGHELYCMGHFVEAALAHRRVTGDERMLEAAVRIADHVVRTFGPNGDIKAVDGHPEIELALAELFVYTNDQDHIDVARLLCQRHDLDALDGMSGHAVRALYLATAMKLVSDYGGDDHFDLLAHRLWGNVVERRSYVTGGIGGRWLGEMVGRDGELPNEMAYAETCAAVAALRLARLMDDRPSVERILHNALLAGIGLDGESWFYSNPLASTGAPDRNPFAGRFDFGAQSLIERFPPRRQPWYDVTCCPTNATRAIAQLPWWFVRQTSHGAEVHHPFTGSLWTRLGTFTLTTPHPWHDGVTVDAPDEMELELRGAAAAPPGGRPSGAWLAEAHPLVESTRGCVAVHIGPVVCCLESADNPGIDLRTVLLDQIVGTEWRPDLLDGVEVVLAQGRAVDDGGPLYRPSGRVAPAMRPVSVTFVPYYAWGHRGTGQMAVWVRDGRRMPA